MDQLKEDDMNGQGTRCGEEDAAIRESITILLPCSTLA
jgi:hypothetical protein